MRWPITRPTPVILSNSPRLAALILIFSDCSDIGLGVGDGVGVGASVVEGVEDGGGPAGGAGNGVLV